MTRQVDTRRGWPWKMASKKISMEFKLDSMIAGRMQGHRQRIICDGGTASWRATLYHVKRGHVWLVINHQQLLGSGPRWSTPERARHPPEAKDVRRRVPR